MAKGRINGNPTDVASRWAQNLGNATTKIQSGVQSVQQAPGARAAQQKGKYVAGVTASADKWAQRVGAVGLADWQSAMINKGLPRIASGAQAAKPKVEQFMGQLLSYEQSQLSAINAMPSMTLQDNLNRAVAWIQSMAKFSYKK